MKIKYICLCCFVLLFSLQTKAQFKEKINAFNRWSVDTVRADRSMLNIDVPIILMSTGILANQFDNNFNIIRRAYTPNFHFGYDDYIQYLPAAVMLGMKFGGVKGRNTWGEMLVADAFSMLLVTGAIRGLKFAVGKQRPDYSAFNSFPSGHTATAFMTATMLHKEYGHISPWVSIGAYTCATLTGLTRQLNNRHWMSDVLMGAGIGIMFVELSYFITDLIFHGYNKNNVRFIYRPDKNQNPSFIAFNTAVKYPLNDFTLKGGQRLCIDYGGSTSIDGAWYMNKNWGVGARVDVSSYSYTQNNEKQETTFGTLITSIGAYHSVPFNSNLRLESKALLGLGLVDRDIQTVNDLGITNHFNFTVGTSLSYWTKKNLSFKFFGEYSLKPNFINYNCANEFSAGLSVSCMIFE